MSNFPAARPGISIDVGAGQSAFPLHADLRMAAAASAVLLDNRGYSDLVFMLGGPDVAVTPDTGVRLPAQCVFVWGKAQATHLAVMSLAGTTSLVFYVGDGAWHRPFLPPAFSFAG